MAKLKGDPRLAAFSSKHSYKKTSYRSYSDLFETKELASGIHLYSHKIVGVMHSSDVFPGLKRYEIIKAFMEQGGEYYVPSCFSGFSDLEEAPRYKDIISGNLKDLFDKISPYIQLVIEPDNKFDRNAFSIRLNSSFCYSSDDLRSMGMGLNVFFDVGYLPKEHKNFILDNYVKYYLVGIEPNKKSFVVELVLCDQFLDNTEVAQVISVSRKEARNSFRNISNMSLRKIRSSLGVD